MDRLASITAFVRVAESGGFTAAARRLNLSTAAVSEQVQALENALGVRLLNRTTRQVSLTEIGREYYERCVQILQELDEADRVSQCPAVDAAWSASRVLPPGRLPVCRADCYRLFGSVPGSVGRFAHRSRDDRPGAGGIRPGNHTVAVAAARLEPDEPTFGRGEVYLVLRPVLSR